MAAERMKKESGDRRGRSRDRGDTEDIGLRKKSRQLEGIKQINPDDYEMIRRFLTEHGKIVPARLTGVSAKQQREVKRVVRRLRVVGILP